MKKYNVSTVHMYTQSKHNTTTEVMTIEEIKNLAYNYLGKSCSINGVVFTSEKELLSDMEYIEKYGSECWLIGDIGDSFVRIDIEEIVEE